MKYLQCVLCLSACSSFYLIIISNKSSVVQETTFHCQHYVHLLEGDPQCSQPVSLLGPWKALGEQHLLQHLQDHHHYEQDLHQRLGVEDLATAVNQRLGFDNHSWYESGWDKKLTFRGQ